MGEKYGEKAHTLTINENGISAHSHPALSGNDTPDHTHDYATEGGTGPPWYAHADNQTYHYFSTYPNAASGGASARHTHAITVNNSGSANALSGHSTVQPSIVKLFAIKYTPVSAASDNTAKGTSISGYFATAPTGYLLEDGTAVSRATYSSLFAVIGTTYGAGDGSTTFNLPDSRGRVSVNKNSSDVEFDTIGEKFGVKVVTITGSETGTSVHSHTAASGTDSPDHTHQYSKEGGTGTWYSHTDTQGSHYFYTYVLNATSGASTRHTHTITVNNSVAANATSAHNNIQPSIVQMFAIRY
ncbi:hypothetical protein CO052_03500 [Candidatus Saccharibacteria bacterium CG_4_9_14_0_2_um_filter_41_9]|nr:MAG: hypothetical protein CO052_03500 [Candidatus Saccharibacteria bacterium CG_4_9_14_0_2_um_filter_41_9]